MILQRTWDSCANDYFSLQVNDPSNVCVYPILGSRALSFELKKESKS